MKYSIKRKNYGVVSAIASPLNLVTVPIDVAKSGYDGILDDVKDTAESGPKVEKEVTPKKSFSEYTPGASNTEKAGQKVGGLAGTAAGSVIGATSAGALGAGIGAKLGASSATKAGTSRLAGSLKGAGKWGLAAAGIGALAGGIAGRNKGKELGRSGGEAIYDSVTGVNKSYSEKGSYTLKRKEYSVIGLLRSGIKPAMRLVRSKASKLISPIAEKTPQPLKDVGKFAWKNKGAATTGLVMGGLMPAGGYIADKAIQSDMAKNGQGFPEQKEKGYSAYSAIGRRVVSGFKKAPEKILGGLSSFSGGGGKKGVESFGNFMKGSSSKTSQRIGDWVVNHPKTSMAASIPIGLAVTGATFDKAQKLSDKTIRKIDKDAFKYSDSKLQEIK